MSKEAKNPGMVTFTVDGKEVVAKPGTNMIDAAKTVGADIPYYCYHPKLSIAANCRMCLVESSQSGKLVPACQTPISEGAAIQTQTAKVKDQQRAIMEFLLLNHPVDCSICDQAGECKLQDYYMRHDHKPSRLEGNKILRNKRKVLGPTVVLDQERCIMCTRCVRFMKEVAKEPQLGVFGRGSHERIDVFPETGGLTSNYSGNTVDLCPVGALLNRDFRFRARAWFLSATPSVCTGCARGCSVYADFMGQDVYRLRPRENEAVNQSWMCDAGRLSYKAANQARALSSRLGRLPDGQEANRLDAASAAAQSLSKHLGKTAVLVSPGLSNEDLLACLRFAKDSLQAKHVYVSGRADGAADDFLMLADKNPNRNGLEAIAKALGLETKPFSEFTQWLGQSANKAAYVAGGDLPVDAQSLSEGWSKLEVLVVQSARDGHLEAAATHLLAASSHLEDEGSFVQAQGLVQRFRRAFPPKGDSLPQWRWASELSKAMGTDWGHGSSRDVFLAWAPQVPALAQFKWDASAPRNQNKPGLTPLATGADGRVPGYREVGAPRVRGI